MATRRQHQARAEAARRDTALQALQLRASGATYRQIGEALGIDKQTAWRLVNVELESIIRESAAEVVELELARLDRMLMAVWPDAVQGDLSSIDRALKIEDMRCRLLGLYRRAEAQQQDIPQSAVIIAADSSSDEYIRALQQIRGELLPPDSNRLRRPPTGNGNGQSQLPD